MPDMERMLERMLEGLALLTQQVSRLAYATEKLTAWQMNAGQLHKCRACSSTIQPQDAVHCLACGEYIKDG